MKLLILGAAGSGHTLIAKALAERMDIPVIQSLSSAPSDYILTEPDDLFDGVSVYIDKHVADIVNVKNVIQARLDTDISCENFDIYLNCTGMDIDAVVGILAEFMYSGDIFEKGIYVPANLCVPASDPIEFDKSLVLDETVEFDIISVCGAYVLRDNFTMAKLFNDAPKLLKVHNKLIHAPSYPLSSVEDYFWWSDTVQDNDGIRTISLRLARYCQTMKTDDFERIYAHLLEYGSPERRLSELGY